MLIKDFRIEIIKNNLYTNAVVISNHVWIISPSQANTVFDHP